MSSSEGGSFTHISYHVGTDGRAWCNVYPHSTPIFGVDAGSATLYIAPKGQQATKAAVEFARALAEQAQRFADELERMYQLADDGDTKAAGSDAA